MTLSEFSLEFDILYDNIASKGAPGIDEYEKSVYLTKAQLELVKEYNNILNKYGKAFDQSEKRRIDLKELLRDSKSELRFTNTDNIDSDAQFFRIPNDVFLIKFERGFVKKTGCDDIRIDIVPVTLDEYNEKIDNPFRKPYDEEAWRIDYYEVLDAEVISPIVNTVEIISNLDIYKYQIRYVKYPQPIILQSLLDFYGDSVDLTIDGISTLSNCELNQEIHREILDRAVELATLDYKEPSLESKIQLNQRNN